MSTLPSFRSLPPVKGIPHGCAWGLWDRPGQPRDQCGTLNLLTPQVVVEAKSEIREGNSVVLNWPLSNAKKPGFGRKPLHHKIFDLAPFVANDDEIELNTQMGSQWDGFSMLSWAPRCGTILEARGTLTDLKRALGSPKDSILLQWPSSQGLCHGNG